MEVLVATARPTRGEGEGGVLALELGCCCSEEPAALDVAAGGESGGEGAAAAN